MSENNKDAIARTALALFMKKGYSSVGIQEICDESGITKPTLYHYFGSKTGLLETIVSSRGGELLSVIEESLIYRHDFLKSLESALASMVTFASSDREYFTLHCVLLSSPEGAEEREVFRPTLERWNAMFLSFFQKSAREFGNMRGKEKLYSHMFSNLVLATAVMVLSGELSGDDATLSSIVHSFVYGVAS